MRRLVGRIKCRLGYHDALEFHGTGGRFLYAVCSRLTCRTRGVSYLDRVGTSRRYVALPDWESALIRGTE